MCDIKRLKIHKKCSTQMEPSIVFLQINNETIGLCQKCWNKIADSDLEWGNSLKLTMEDIFSDKSRLGDNPVETEYKERGIKNDEPSEEEEDE